MIQSFPNLCNFRIKQNMYLPQSGKCIFSIKECTVIRTVNLSAYPTLVSWIEWDLQQDKRPVHFFCPCLFVF